MSGTLPCSPAACVRIRSIAASPAPWKSWRLTRVPFKDDLIAEDGTINNDGTLKFPQGFLDRYVAWIKHFAA